MLPGFANNGCFCRHVIRGNILSFKGCSCQKGGLETSVVLEPGQRQALLNWPTPISCENGDKADIKNTIVDPPRTSPSYFPPGEHVINYKYVFYNNDNLTCSVKIDVQGELQTLL